MKIQMSRLVCSADEKCEQGQCHRSADRDGGSDGIMAVAPGFMDLIGLAGI
jgi:hypothetical protein